MSVENNITELRKELPSTVKLVAVSKFMPNELIMEAYNAGQRDFGENRPQELNRKMAELPSDIRWHFLGHLQTNKIKLIIDSVSLIHSADSLRLISEIGKEAAKRGLVKDILIQQHISSEDTKQGFSSIEMEEAAIFARETTGIRVCGVMGMATYTDDMEQVRGEFRGLRLTFEKLKSTLFADDRAFEHISMGMSGDFPLAVEEGSTIVRVGTRIFGSRY
ncbi:MAG: YggS family pyridoxal phosphate-dependent enzyme [Bacteroidetes bacterium HGW-Bacteroidetes-14]|jgi:hypothetical protein|nr:MAG: YggS family pyridoxal phosphate-dependent enzyme [Bacteroidetes bacterium HGW-Bacteroidetes-14]